MESIVMNNLVTQFFSIDHQRLDFLFRMYRENKGGERYKAVLLFDKFRTDLTRHINWEEELLFPAFDKAMGLNGVGPTEVMRQEHQKIKGLLERISQSLKADEHSENLEKELMELLLLHNEKEEQILYVQCDRTVTDEQLVAMFLEI